jgi:hypothetical protein
MFKLGVVVAAATIAVGMFSLSTAASARVGGRMGGGGAAHFGGGAHFRGGMANFGGGLRFGGARFAKNGGAWNGYRGYGYGRYGGYGWDRFGLGLGLAGLGLGYPAYASCYAWTPLGYVNQCGYDYSYSW